MEVSGQLHGLRYPIYTPPYFFAWFRFQEPPILLYPEQLQSAAPFHKLFLLYDRAVSPSSNPEAGGQPLVGSPRLFIQYIHSYRLYLEAVVTETH
jgi:hypothetical protein